MSKTVRKENGEAKRASRMVRRALAMREVKQAMKNKGYLVCAR
jgi:hypothetical protein